MSYPRWGGCHNEKLERRKSMIQYGTILRNDTLIVKDGKTYIVYSPFKNLITRIPEFPEENSGPENTLKEKGFFNQLPDTVRQDNQLSGFNSLTLLLNRRCNLCCVYCYAAPKITGPSMPIDLAIDAVDWYLNHNLSSMVRITFHGGGEPTLEQGLIKKVVAHIESLEQGLPVRYLIVTNGTTDKNFLDWMMKKKFAISISIDGPSAIQDRNRPFADGTSSSQAVENNIKYLVSCDYPPGVRLTYSPKDDVICIFRYFGKLGIKNIHFEPLFPYGRLYDNVEFGNKNQDKIYSPGTKELLNGFLQALDICKEYKMRLYNGHIAHFAKGIGYFCGAASVRSMLVTHDGLLTACLEVVDSDDKDIEMFGVGKWIRQEHRFEVDIKKISVLQRRHADNLSECRECFARYTCAGGCAVKAVRAKQGLFGRDISYCGFTRAFIPILIKRIANESKI